MDEFFKDIHRLSNLPQELLAILSIRVVDTPFQPKIRTMTTGAKTAQIISKEPGGITTVVVRT